MSVNIYDVKLGSQAEKGWEPLGCCNVTFTEKKIYLS